MDIQYPETSIQSRPWRDQYLASMNLGFLFMAMVWVYPKNIILKAV